MLQWLRAEIWRLRNTCVWSWQGFAAAWASEKSLRQWTTVHAISVLLACVLDLETAERALIIALGFVLLAAELMNTSIEEVVDYLSTEADPRAKKAKDCASAAVALSAIAGGAAWLVVLIG
ncbi:MAG: diacylglycerol kinase [Rhodobacteraceae bacterium]|nr:diacylglycerol kinase [Paracoccaceae bacterium]